jgi:hypothetical protein
MTSRSATSWARTSSNTLAVVGVAGLFGDIAAP